MIRTRILGTGHYVPERVVTNDELSKLMDTSDEWIRQRTGIQERRFVDFENDPMGASELGTRAAKEALNNAGVDLVDCQTTTPHLISLGAEEINRNDFLDYLDNNCFEEDTKDCWAKVVDAFNES